MVIPFMEHEHFKQSVMQSSQERTAGDTQGRSVPAILAKFTSAVFLPLLAKMPRM